MYCGWRGGVTGCDIGAVQHSRSLRWSLAVGTLTMLGCTSQRPATEVPARYRSSPCDRPATDDPTDTECLGVVIVRSRRAVLAISRDVTRWVAARRMTSYVATLQRAMDGDRKALAAMMRFTRKMGAASGLGHGVILVDLAALNGDSMFASIAGRLPPPERQRIREVLAAGFAYHWDSELFGKSLVAVFPETARVTAR